MRQSTAAALLLVAAMAGRSSAGWTGPVTDKWKAEVDEYEHGIVRLRLREEGVSRYEVSDVVVAEAKAAPAPRAGLLFESAPGSKLALEGTTARFDNGKGVTVEFEMTKEPTEAAPSLAADLKFPQAERLYGIPEHATDTALKDNVIYRLMNLDVYMYKLDSPGGIYGSKPFMHAHGKAGTVGILWLNSADTNVAVRDLQGAGMKTNWESVGGSFDVFFFPGPTPADVLRQYSHVTGKMAMHPLFSLGYHQCRWNYRSQDDTLSVDEGFDKHHIPYDVIWLDIEHTDGKKYFTWDAYNFPNPEEMINKIAAKGRKVVTISDPHIKRAQGYHVHDTAVANGYYVKTASGSDFEGHCWPGTSSWLDYYSAKVRSWYASLFKYENYKGSTPDLYTWIDMNEPSVFNAKETTMDMAAVHTRDDGYKAQHRDLHNMYGYYQTMAAYQGLYERTLGPPHKTTSRPFILSRSFFSGSQRYAAVWTGDNLADWGHLEKSIPMLLSMSLAGLPFVGADVGGFFENPSAELLVRWYQIGAFYPFFRGHAHLETKRREPWLFGEEVTDRIRTAIVTRYSIMPYLYTQFFRGHAMGESVLLPLYFEFPQDSKVFDIDRQMLVGPSLMVKPVTQEGATTVTLYLPGEDPWYNFATGEKHLPGGEVTLQAPLDYLPVLQRGGSIVAKRQRVRRSTTSQFWDPVTLVVALGKQGQAEGDLYHDDTHSFEYQQGSFIHRRFTYANGALKGGEFVDNSPYRTQFPKAKTFDTAVEVERIIIYGLAAKPEQVSLTIRGVRVGSPPELQWDVSAKVLTVRKPSIPVTADFTLSFNKEADQKDEL